MSIKDIQLPSYFTDPIFKQTQGFLAPYGMDILKGNIPDYYKNIGMAGSPEFLNMLNMAKRDVSTAVTEDMARRNVLGGAASLAMAKGIGDVSTTMRYQDYLNSIQGKEFLFSGGKSITEGAREAGLSYGTSMNQFNLGATELGLKKEGMLAEQKAQENAMWSQILKSVVGAAGMAAGIALAPATGGASIPILGSAGNIISGGKSKFGGGQYDISSILYDIQNE